MPSAVNRERRRFLKQPMVVLLTIGADFPHFTLKTVEHSRYLPSRNLAETSFTNSSYEVGRKNEGLSASKTPMTSWKQ
jgi:hypothetical protein